MEEPSLVVEEPSLPIPKKSWWSHGRFWRLLLILGITYVVISDWEETKERNGSKMINRDQITAEEDQYLPNGTTLEKVNEFTETRQFPLTIFLHKNNEIIECGYGEFLRLSQGLKVEDGYGMEAQAKRGKWRLNYFFRFHNGWKLEHPSDHYDNMFYERFYI